MKSQTADETSTNSSQATRRRLLDAGLQAFGKSGFDAVSTRKLADMAGANQAAIPYHFGGKTELYLAVVKDLVTTVQQSVGATASHIQERLDSGPLSLEEGEPLIAELVKSMVDFLVGADQSRHRATFVIRELMQPSQAFDLLYDGYMRQVHTIVTRLVAALLDEDPTSETSILRAHVMIGQVMVFGAGRELILRRTNWQNFSDAHLQQITEVVTETFVASIRAQLSAAKPNIITK